MDLLCVKIHILPFQCEHLTSPQAGGYSKQDERALSGAEIREQALQLLYATKKVFSGVRISVEQYGDGSYQQCERPEEIEV